MISTAHYASPLGSILLAEQLGGLVGLWFEGQKYFLSSIKDELTEQETPLLRQTKNWLDRYFTDDRPQIGELRLTPRGSDFQQSVWRLLMQIPYGEVTTYGELARRLGRERTSAQAVGGAVGRNPISVIIPCHRVVGASGSLTGYAGGLDKKIFLLSHEGVATSGLFGPQKGAAF